MRLAGSFDIGSWLAVRDDVPTESGATRDGWVDVVVQVVRAEHAADVIDPIAPIVRATIQHGIGAVHPGAIGTLQHWPTPMLTATVVTIEGAAAPPSESTDVRLMPSGVDPDRVAIGLVDAPHLGVGCEVRYGVPTGDRDVPELVGVSLAFRGERGVVRILAEPTLPALVPRLVDDLRGLAACVELESEAGEPAWERGTTELAPLRPDASERWTVEGVT